MKADQATCDATPIPNSIAERIQSYCSTPVRAPVLVAVTPLIKARGFAEPLRLNSSRSRQLPERSTVQNSNQQFPLWGHCDSAVNRPAGERPAQITTPSR